MQSINSFKKFDCSYVRKQWSHHSVHITCSAYVLRILAVQNNRHLNDMCSFTSLQAAQNPRALDQRESKRYTKYFTCKFSDMYKIRWTFSNHFTARSFKVNEFRQEAQLSQRDRATLKASWSLVNIQRCERSRLKRFVIGEAKRHSPITITSK